jgi:large repetitive protein
MNAIPVCQNSYTQSSANLGVGTITDLNASNQGCLTNGESNSTWYLINTVTNGTIEFTITPASITADYDFAVWDLTDTSCAAISNGLAPIKCNYASLANSTAGGLTGLSTSAAASSYGAAGPSFSSSITAIAGQTFAILINNSSSSTAGYTIDFTGSTSQILDNATPTIKNIIVPPNCSGPTQIKIILKENIKCSSLTANGSEFSISGGAIVSSATSTSCTAGGVFTSIIYVNTSTAFAPGTYTCTINSGTDGNTLIDNCNNNMLVGTNFSFTVLPPVNLIITPSFGCSGSATGSISAAGINGTPPYQYKLNSGIYSAANTFNGLSAGTYTIYVKDSFGCINDTIVTLAPGPSITISGIIPTNLLCYNSNTGQIVVSASGGAPPLQYAANALPYSLSNIITGLGPGIFVVHVKDANGCIKDTNVLLTSPGPIIISSAVINNITCLGGSNGNISIAAIGGTTPLQYALNAGAYSSFGNFSSLASGTYTVHIKDANNCIKDTIINITQPSSLLTAQIISTVQPSCVGSSGSIVGGAIGGVSPYTFSIDGSNYFSSSTFTGLASGSYTVFVKDAGGCIATISVLLISPGNLFFSGATLIQPTCITTGSITVTGVGGVLPYTFANGASAYSSTNSFTGLSAGTYTIHIKDNNGCIHDTIINLSAPPIPLIAVTNIIHTTCSNPNNGSITVAASNGTAAYTFSLNGGAYASATTYPNLIAGTYTIVVKDANGCTQSITATIQNTNTVNFATFTITNIGCNGTPLGSINSTGLGGISPYTFNINGGAFVTSGLFSNLSAGTYTVIVKDASGCTFSSVAIINTSANLGFASCAAINATCSNPGNGSLTATSIGGVSPVNLTINGVAYLQGTISGLSPNTYTLIFTDANGCTVTCTQTITGPAFLYANNTVVVQPLCFGGFGSISTGAIGGVPPYTFAINNGAYTSTANYTSLTPGSYTIHIQDNNGCIHDTIIIITQPSPIALGNLTVVNAACNGNATGSISVVGSGTVGPYTYSINGGGASTNNIFNNLAIGTYTIIVTDANNCTISLIQSINNNGNFYFGTSSIVIPSCVGSADGSVTFTATGGALPYTYKINTGLYQASNNFTGLTAGTYTLFVKDNNGCIVNTTIVISNPTPLIFPSIIITNPLCPNYITGSVLFTASGGTGPYTYRIDGGAFVTGNNFTGLAAGSHTISIKDSKNCIKDSIIIIINPPSIYAGSSSVINPGCFGNGGGSIVVNGIGGTSPYTYAINAGAYSSVNTFPGLAIGTYTVHIKDVNNCIHDTIITLSSTLSVAITSVLSTNSNCPNQNTGSITVAASSPFTPVTYSLNGGTAGTSGFYNNLVPGIYTIHVQDALGCYRDTVITISSLSTLVLNSVNITNLLCADGNTGSVTINATGTGGTLNYAINSGAYSSFSTINNLSIGTYTIHVQDAYGCIKDSIINLTAPPPINFINILLTAPFCDGSLDGAISVAAAGGIAPYQFNINGNPFSNISNFTNLIQGVYTFQVIDANNCLQDTIVNLQAPIVVFYSNVNISNVACFGASNGSITVMAGGGISPYTYSFNNSPYTIANNFSSLAAGTYTVSALDNGGCKKDTVITITAPTTSVAISFSNILHNKCRGDSNGTFTAAGNGGTGPYYFSLNNNSSFSNINTFNNLQAGLYTIYIQDANGCQSFDTIRINEPLNSNQIIFISSQKNSCIGVYDATLTVSTINGTAPFLFLINGINNGTDTFFNNLIPGDYVVEVTDSLGCKSSGKYTIDSSVQKPNIIINNLVPNICKTDALGIIDWDAINYYSYFNSTINSNPIGLTNIASNLANGIFQLQITDSIGCYADTFITIHYYDSILVSVTKTDAKCAGFGDDGTASASVIYGANPIAYLWSNSASVANIMNLNYGLYTVIATDSLGCKDTADVEINYNPCCKVWIPNAFSPNNDNTNEYIFTLPSGPISFVHFSIYNRYGQKVFESTDFNSRWNGTFLGQPCDVGTYFYLAKFKCPLNPDIIIQKGDITLVK